MTTRTCPKCGSPLQHYPPDPDAGVIGAFACAHREHCDYFEPDHEDRSDFGIQE